MQEQKNKGRQAKLILVIGANGTGKSTLITQLVNAELKAKRKALIITPHFTEWNTFNNVPVMDCTDIYNMKGIERIHFTGEMELFDKIIKEFFNGMLVMDDCRAYIKPNLNQSIKALLISRRQIMTDIVMAFHNVVDVPPQVFYYAPEIILKKTSASFQQRKNLIFPEYYEKLEKAQERVNKHSNKYYYEIIK